MKKYDDDSIKTLDSISHLRARVGMYLGKLGDGSHADDGIYILLKEVIDNSIDEFIMNFGTRVEVTVDKHSAAVRDYGRGIPLGKVIDCVSVINTGGKFSDDGPFEFSVGLNGVGTKAVNALSEQFYVASYREGKFVSAKFSKGVLIEKLEGNTKEKDGTYVVFEPDEEVFGKFEFRKEFVDARIRDYTFLNSGLVFDYEGEELVSTGGLEDLTKQFVSVPLYDPIYFKTKELEFAVTHTNEYGDSYRSYVNGQYTSDGGTHLTAFKEGITRGVNAALKKQYKADDVREGMFAAVAIKIKDPVFESQTKIKLGNTNVKQWVVPRVAAAIEDYLRKNPDTLKKLETKVEQNESIRTKFNDVRKEAREASKRVSVRVDKLKDCKKHRGDGKAATMLFVVEGDSACFVGNTKLMLANGSTVKMSKLEKKLKEEGDLYVVGYKDDKFDTFRVTKVTKRKSSSLVTVTFQGSKTYRCTADHEFLTKTRGYVSAVDLVHDEEVTSYSLTLDECFSMRNLPRRLRSDVVNRVDKVTTYRGTKTVYDVTVEDAHNFVLDNGAVVHNCGSITPSRDVMTQAVFALRGKPENMYDKSKGDIYKNKELHNLVTALGIENSIDDMRYDYVVIATDADFDGFHIRNLVMTFFLQFYPELVEGHQVLVLETPLFRVRDKKITTYCYSEKERDDAVKKSPSSEVTRFKGLGEISPHEFGQFIGPSMKAKVVHVPDKKDVKKVLSFYSGPNTSERRDIIIAHLKEVL